LLSLYALIFAHKEERDLMEGRIFYFETSGKVNTDITLKIAPQTPASGGRGCGGAGNKTNSCCFNAWIQLNG